MTATATLIAEGLSFGEGPRWHEGRLWVSDFYNHRVLSFDEQGGVRTELELDDRPSGLGWMPDGSLLVVGMTQRKLWRRSPGGVLALHADLSAIATGHCNDMVVDTHGGAYVGNFGCDLEAAVAEGCGAALIADPPLADLAYVAPDGSVTRAATGLRFPNGMVMTPGGGTLIVAETFGRCLTAFAMAAAGSLSDRRIWADCGRRMPDGICLDAEGAIWVANPLAPECVRVGEGSAILDSVATVEPCYAAMLGGADGRTLFVVTAPYEGTDAAKERRHGRVRAARVTVPHAGRP